MITPIILAGGSGTRLWPLSREQYPKQLLPLLNDKSLLQHTLGRVTINSQIQHTTIICNAEYRFLVAEQARQILSRPATIMLEPAGRNTAPAIAIAALQAQLHELDPLLLILPADHLLLDNVAFNKVLDVAVTLAKQDKLVTFGIKPTKPETGYGYIQTDPARSDIGSCDASSYKVISFTEKPNQAKAEQYLATGGYYWNSGMFMFRAATILTALQEFAPDILQCCVQAFEQRQIDQDFIRINEPLFTNCRSESIDYAVMEKTDAAVMIPLDTAWNDVGSWTTLWEISEQNHDGNVLHGDIVADQTKNCYLHATNRMVAVVGMSDCIVMETADAVLVANKASSQDIKNIVAHMKQAGRKEVISHRKAHRPWGSYEILDDEANFKVKRICVAPGGSLSLQLHHYRAEHWIIVSGIAEVTCGDQVFQLFANQSTYIPMGTKHRLHNPGAEALILIEVQSGNYLGEDDIIRFADAYGR